MQGFLFSKPVDAEAAGELYKEACEADPFSLASALL
jgi:EAL domain-containing protein (putative c-di-GMP-specific phosphodiesterase class I)